MEHREIELAGGSWQLAARGRRSEIRRQTTEDGGQTAASQMVRNGVNDELTVSTTSTTSTIFTVLTISTALPI